MKKLKLPYRMRAAINTYFAVKHFYGGNFPCATIKEEVIKGIDREAHRYGIRVQIMPGVIELRKGNAEIRVDTPLYL